MNFFKLDNGLKVFIHENPGTKTVAIDAWVRAGAGDEPQHISGISHFLEHMLFKGTKRFKPGEIDRVIEGVGGVWNAETSEDYTHLFVSVAAPYFETCFSVLADVIKNSIIDPDEVEKERLVILEEYARKQDNPAGFLLEQVYNKTYEYGPYKQPILGTPETIKNICHDVILEYYRRYYTHDNMTLVIIGDIKADEIIPYIRKHFADSALTCKPYPISYKCRYAKRLHDTHSRQVGDTYMIMSFPAPGFRDIEDVFAMDVLTVILGEGRSSRLYYTIREKRRLVSSIDVSYSPLRLDSLLLITATLGERNLAKAKLAICEQLQRLREQKPTRKEVQKAQRMITNSYYYATETNAGQAGLWGLYYTLTGSDEFMKTYLERIKDISAEIIQKSAEKYLVHETANFFIIVPETSDTSLVHKR